MSHLKWLLTPPLYGNVVKNSIYTCIYIFKKDINAVITFEFPYFIQANTVLLTKHLQVYIWRICKSTFAPCELLNVQNLVGFKDGMPTEILTFT